MAAAAVIAAGTLISAAGAGAEAQSRSQAAEYNAKINNLNAEAALDQAREDENRQRSYADRQLGDMRASYGASGVSSASGSALEVLAQSASDAERDSLNIRHQGAMKAWAYKSGSSLDTMNAANARMAGGYGVASAIFGGANSGFASGAFSSGKSSGPATGGTK